MSSYNLHRSGEAIDELLTTLMDKGHVGQILKRDSDNDMVWEPITAENVTDSLGYVPMSMPTNQGTIDQVLRSNGEGGTYWAEDTNQAKINSAVNTWMDGHISENNTVALDDSLTQTGAAAQAKATGDMIIAASTQPSQTTNKVWINTGNAPDVQLTTPGDLENIIAPEYSSSATYNVGDYVLYNDVLYRCKVAITTAEEWTAAHWTSAVLGQDVCDLKSALNNVISDNGIAFESTAAGVVPYPFISGVTYIIENNNETGSITFSTRNTPSGSAVDGPVTIGHGQTGTITTTSDANYLRFGGAVKCSLYTSTSHTKKSIDLEEEVNELHSDIENVASDIENVADDLVNTFNDFDTALQGIGLYESTFEYDQGFFVYASTGGKATTSDMDYAMSKPIFAPKGTKIVFENRVATTVAVISYSKETTTFPKTVVYAGTATQQQFKYITEDDVYITLSFNCSRPFKLYMARADKAELKGDALVELNKYGNIINIISRMNNTTRMKISCDLHGSENGAFNMASYKTLDNSGNETAFKDASDDICPLRFGRNYIGANHGYNYRYTLTASSAHGLTTANIGQLWQDNNSNILLIIRIPSTTTIEIVCPDLSAMNYCYMKELSGITSITKDGTTIQISSSSRGQLRSSINHISVHIYGDNGEKIVDNGTYAGKHFDVVEQYDIWYPPAMFTYLQENVGSNTNDSVSDESIDRYCTVRNTYRFTDRGAMTVFSTVNFKYAVRFSNYGIIQSIKVGDYYFVPNTKNDHDLIALQGNSTVTFTPSLWKDENNPPNRFFQFVDAGMSKGFCVGYNTLYGDGKPSEQKTADTVGNYYGETHKMYPTVADKAGDKDAGFTVSGIGYRIPMIEYDSDIPCVGWYFVNDDIYLLIDSQTSVNKIIELPNYMNGMIIETVETLGNITINEDFVTSNGIGIAVTNYGSAILKLKT